jgi:tetratricopeptide (TPR) repeat protein
MSILREQLSRRRTIDLAIDFLSSLRAVDADVANQFETDIDQALTRGELDRAEQLAARYCSTTEQDSLNGEVARSPRFRAAYLAAQVSLAAGRLAQALELLRPLLTVADRLPEALAGRVRLFTAEALARLRLSAEARELLSQVPAGLLDRQPLLQLRNLRIRLWLREVTDMGTALAACARDLEDGDEIANLALLICEEGRAWDEAGDLARARQCWERAEHLSRGLGTDPIRADVLLQLGRLDHLRGHLASALDRYETALACAGAGPQALELQLRLLLVRLELNQWDQARAAANQLLPEGSLERLPEEVRPLAALVQALLSGAAPAELSDEQRAYQAAECGNVEAARSLYHRALASTPSPERQARLALALGMLALAQGERAEADAWLRRAEEMARTLDLPEVLGRALQARGQALAEQGDADGLARRLFEEAVLISEVQAGQFAHRLDAAAYRRQHAGVLRRLLHAACRRGDAEGVFRYQELERGRLLLELWHATTSRSGRPGVFEGPELSALEDEIEALEQELTVPAAWEDRERRRTLLHRLEEVHLHRDRQLEEFLRDRSRRATAALPALPDLDDLRRSLPPHTLYLAPALAGEELYLLAVSREGPPRVIRGRGATDGFREGLTGLGHCLTAQLARYRHGLPLGRQERDDLDGRLDDLGRGPLGDALSQALAGQDEGVRRLLWVPDDPLHGLPIHALRRQGRYLVEDHEIVWTFSGALVVHQARTRRQVRGRLRPALVVTEAPTVLPEAVHEGRGVAGSFLWSRTLHGPAATRTALHHELARARVVHFACHAHFDSDHPLAACIGLPSGETLRALEWLDEPVAGLPLVTLSACRSAEVAPLLGREVFGLVTGLLGGGVRAVLAGLWPVADREVPPLMWRFYRQRLTGDLATALTQAQRETLAEANASPLFWAAFALFGDAAALPAPGRWGRWLARWRQRRFARRFPVPIPDERSQPAP